MNIDLLLGGLLIAAVSIGVLAALWGWAAHIDHEADHMIHGDGAWIPGRGDLESEIEACARERIEAERRDAA